MSNYMLFSHACVWMREKAKSISSFPQSIPLLERIQKVIIATAVWKFLPKKLQPHSNKMFFMGFSLFIKANTSIISGQVILTMLMHNATIFKYRSLYIKEANCTSDRLRSVANTTIHSLNLTEHIWAKRNSASNRLCKVPIWSWKKREDSVRGESVFEKYNFFFF